MGPETTSGTQIPVWYGEAFERMMSNGTFTVDPKDPLSPTITIIVLVRSGS